MSQASCMSSETGFPAILRRAASGFRPLPTVGPNAWQWFLLDGFEAGYAREDELPSAAKACHVVGGDGVDEDDFVSFDDAGVDPYVSASCRGADVGQHGFVGGDVLVHFNAGSDFLAHAGDVFLVGVDARVPCAKTM